MEKLCPSCQTLKSSSDFFRSKATKDGFNRICKECDRLKKERRYHSMNADQKRWYSYRWSIMKKFGISEIEYHRYFDPEKRKNLICEICGSNKALCFDHDHSRVDPHIRGILCKTCNWGLGQFKDDTDLLQRAIDYLINKKPESS